MSEEQLVDLTYDEIEHETAEAWLFVFDKLLKWVPKNVGSLDRDDGIVQVPEWFATKEGLV